MSRPDFPDPLGAEPSADGLAAPDLLVTGLHPALPDPAAVAETPGADRRAAGHALASGRREADRRLAAVVEGMSDAFLSLDTEWRVTYANREACRLAGLPRDALLGRDHWTQWPETAGSDVERRYREVVATGEAARFEHHYPAADVWHAIHAYPARGGGLAVFYRDVTREKRAAAERERLLAEAESLRAQAEADRARVAASEARYRELFAGSPVPMWVFDGETLAFLAVNPAAVAQYGFTEREFLGMTVADLGAAGARPEPGRGTARHRRRDGVVLDVDVTTQRIEYGGRPAWVAVAVDVTARARAAAALAESEARYRSLAEAVPVQVWSASADGLLDFTSERTAAYFGAPAESLRGAGWTAYVHPDDLPAALARWAAALADGTPYETEFRLRSADGEYRWHLARALAVRDGAGAVAGWVGSNTDVEAERRARTESEAARRAAEEANAAKAQFLATMSHELRTPLNAISGYTQLLAMGVRGPVTDAQQADLARIQASQQHLLGLINSVLNYAKLEAGRVAYDLADVALGPALAAVEALVSPQMQAKGVGYHFDACDPCLTVRADAEKLRQIVLNLLSNAVKFTPRGGRVVVSCAASGPAAVAVRVADTGVGIAAGQLGRVFDPFVQVGRRLNTPDEGVGLGLAISRDLARGMGGDLTAESEPGAGSTFTLTLPRVR